MWYCLSTGTDKNIFTMNIEQIVVYLNALYFRFLHLTYHGSGWTHLPVNRAKHPDPKASFLALNPRCVIIEWQFMPYKQNRFSWHSSFGSSSLILPVVFLFAMTFVIQIPKSSGDIKKFSLMTHLILFLSLFNATIMPLFISGSLQGLVAWAWRYKPTGHKKPNPTRSWRRFSPLLPRWSFCNDIIVSISPKKKKKKAHQTSFVSPAPRWKEAGRIVQAARLGRPNHPALVPTKTQPRETEHPCQILWKHVRPHFKTTFQLLKDIPSHVHA